MAIKTNFVTPTSMNNPPYGKGELVYRVKTFKDYTDAALMDTDVNAFLDGLIVEGAPWPHVISISFEMTPMGVNTMIACQVFYLLVSP